MGGFNGHEYLSSMEKYDETTNEWETLPAMTTPRAKFSAIVSSDCRYIYVIGGENESESKPLKSIERFNLLEFVWEPVSNLKTGRCSHQTVLI